MIDVSKAWKRGAACGLLAVLLGCSDETVQTGKKPAATLEAALAEFQAELEPARQYFEVPGAAVAVVHGGEVVFQRGLGLRNVERDEPVTTDTVFRIGSITKAFTSMLVGTLVDEGVLAFEDRAAELWPELRLPSEELVENVTVLELMGMGTGMAPNSEFWWELETASELGHHLETLELAVERGTYLYNNMVYSSAAYVALAAAGESEPLIDAYAAALETRILRPIGMQSAAVSDDPSTVSDDFADSYLASLADGLDFQERAEFIATNAVAPAGAVVSDVTGLAQFALTVLGSGIAPDGTVVVSPESLSTTQRPQTPVANDELPFASAYAAGWLVGEDGGQPVLWHNGGVDGFYSVLRLVPESDLGLVILTNGMNGSLLATYLEAKLMELVFGETSIEPNDVQDAYQDLRAALARFSNASADSPRLDASEAELYVGRYEHGFSVEFDAERGRLWVTAPATRGVLLPVPGLADTFIVGSGRLFGLACRPELVDDAVQVAILDPLTLETAMVIRKLD